MGEPARPLVVMSPEDLARLVREAVRAEFDARGSADAPAEVLTREQAAELLQLHPAVVTRYIKREGLPAHKLGPEWRFRRSELLRWLDERRRLA